jgi:hypothetical protein
MIGYVAKDKNGEVYLHTEEPTYDNELEGWYATIDFIDITEQFPEFDNMSYTDEPIKVEIKLKRV